MTSEDETRKGRPKLFGFGLGYLGRIGAAARWTVRRALDAGIPLHDPVEAIAWALARRDKARLADEVLEALGYEPRYIEEM